MQESCEVQNTIFTQEYNFTLLLIFSFLKANRKPAACSRCENEMGAKTENRQICPYEGLGNRNPQRDGQEVGKTHFEVFELRSRILL